MKIIYIAICAALASTITADAAGVKGVKDFEGIEKYVSGAASPASPAQFSFMADGNYYLQLSPDRKRIVKFETRSGKESEVIFDVEKARETKLPSIQGFTMSPDGSKIMVWRDLKMVYRRSFTASYYVYEIRSKLLKPLSEERPRQQAPIFSPDGRMAAYVSDNNIYIKKLDYGTDIAVTTDGKKNMIINGVPDWTYEEEFSTASSMTWASDNLTLCYLKYNETDVPVYNFTLYEGTCPQYPQYANYPGEFSYKYPVAGEKNSVVTLHSYNVETRKTKDITLPDSRIEYIPRIKYAPTPEQLIVSTLNRDQNRLEIYSVNPKSTTAKSLIVEESDAWIAPATYEDMKLTNDGIILPSSRTGYQHFYKYSYAGALVGALTSGDYDVDTYYGYDAAHGYHYYRSTATGAINRVISRKDKKGKIVNLTPDQGTASAVFSPDMLYYTLNYSNATTPPKHTLRAAVSEKELRVLEDNAAYYAKYASAPKPEFFTMTANGLTFNGYMIKPTDFNASNRYPVIMYQYSGPGSQEVLNRWTMGWANYYATRGYIIMCVDGRGTGGRGRKFMDAVYKNLGHYESIDQVSAAKYAASLPYVDASRIGIYGWSFGGYETIMASSQPDAPYAAAVAVAPVTDWRFYDTVYAERYMLTPQQNEKGYHSSSAMSCMQQRKCPLLIITGTADDNVHFYNTVQYFAEMEGAGIWADLMIFPNENHFIMCGNARSVVYSRMLDYFDRNMK
ncbi:MAG: S9 family peptidase [Muribaculaceae bacterium]|nr:S9 family peptidase [Muribaculaceae bacterium]